MSCSRQTTPICYHTHLHHRVASYSSITKMSSANLALVFGPTLTRAPEGANPHTLHNDVPSINILIQLCIERHVYIFGEEDEEERLNSPPPPPDEPALSPPPPPLMMEEVATPEPASQETLTSDDSPPEPSSQEDPEPPLPTGPPPAAAAIAAVAAAAFAAATGVSIPEPAAPVSTNEVMSPDESPSHETVKENKPIPVSPPVIKKPSDELEEQDTKEEDSSPGETKPQSLPVDEGAIPVITTEEPSPVMDKQVSITQVNRELDEALRSIDEMLDTPGEEKSKEDEEDDDDDDDSEEEGIPVEAH